MTNLHNIEKSGFRKGEYVGYGAGHVWRIRKQGGSHWYASQRDSTRELNAATLRELSDKLAALPA